MITKPFIFFIDNRFYEQRAYFIYPAFHAPFLVIGKKRMQKLIILVQDQLGVFYNGVEWKYNIRNQEKDKRTNCRK